MRLIHMAPDVPGGYYCGNGGGTFAAARVPSLVTCPDCLYRVVALAPEIEAGALRDDVIRDALGRAYSDVLERVRA